MGGRGACSRWVLACLLAGMGCCASPQRGDHELRSSHLTREVLVAVEDLPTTARRAVVRRLLEAAHGMLGQGDAMHALRVLALCRRLEQGNADLAIVTAEMQCRAGDLPGAHAGFRLAQALARQVCRISGENSLSPGTGHPADGTQDCSEADLIQAKKLVVSSSTRHGMCLMEARRFREAASRFREALALDQDQEGIAWHLGLACDYGENWPGAVQAYLHWLRIQRMKAPPRPAAALARPQGRPTVAFFCLHRTPDAPGGRWGSNSLEQRGIGGSEEAVILVSRELVALGFHVEVYAYPPDHEVGPDDFGVFWLPVHSYGANGLVPPDIFVSWRCYALATQGGRGALNFLWLHDRVIPKLLPSSLLSGLAGVLLLSEHHKAQLPAHALPKGVLTRNGVAQTFWQSGPNHYNHFIFASHPERGLEQLLEVWPLISAGVHGSRLDLYHGFPESYGESGAPEPELAKMRAFRARVERLLKNVTGVYMHGMVNQATLGRAYARAAFWLYPTSMAETSCISAMKAMGNGAIPITSRLAKSGLVETTGTFDLGPVPSRAGATMDSDREMLLRWAHTVIDAARSDREGKLEERRKEMIGWSRRTYSWSAVAEQWSHLFRQHGGVAR